MDRVQLVDEGGYRMMITDLRALPAAEALQVLQAAHLLAIAQPRDGKLLSLVLVKNMRFDTALLDKMTQVGKAGAPWVKATAFAGMSALGRVVFRAIAPLTGRKVSAFDTEEEARKWLFSVAAG
jgi:hypothetical protein